MILNMNIGEGYEFIKNAVEQEREEKLYLRWVVGYQTTTTYVEFKNRLKQSSDRRTSEEILNDVESIMSAFFIGET